MKRWKKVLISVISVVLLLCAGYGFFWWKQGGETWYRYTFHKNHEPYTFYKQTSTKAVYSDWRFKHYLKQYDAFNNMDLDQIVKDSYIIPGLKATYTIENTKEQQPGICSSMTPQGVALTDDYLLISAYCQTKEHHSVIYVVNRETHEFIKEVILPDLSHVGSIAYDKTHENIWVCCHDNKSHVAYVRAFTLSHLENYDFANTGQPIEYDQSYPIITQIRASFMTYHDNALYVGYFQSDFSSETTVQKFILNEEGGLTMVENPMMRHYDDPKEIILPNSLAVINGGAQGYTENKTHSYVLTSSGSARDSMLYEFDNLVGDDGNLDARAISANRVMHLPPMAEELYLDDDKLYICFESAAYAYRARKCDHMDRILVFSIDELEE